LEVQVVVRRLDTGRIDVAVLWLLGRGVRNEDQWATGSQNQQEGAKDKRASETTGMSSYSFLTHLDPPFPARRNVRAIVTQRANRRNRTILRQPRLPRVRNPWTPHSTRTGRHMVFGSRIVGGSRFHRNAAQRERP